MTPALLAARRGNDVEGWVNILFVVVMVVVYLVGAVVKAANKSQQEKKAASQPRRPIPRPAQGRPHPRPNAQAGASAQRPGALQASALTDLPRAADARAAAVASVADSILALSATTPRTPAVPALKLATVHPTVTDLTPPASLDLQTPSQTADLDIPPVLCLEDLAGDELQKAILYSEIIGRPLALRAPLEPVA